MRYQNNREFVEELVNTLGIRSPAAIQDVQKIVETQGENAIKQKLPLIKKLLERVLSQHQELKDDENRRAMYEGVVVTLLEADPVKIMNAIEVANYLEVQQKIKTCQIEVVVYHNILMALEVTPDLMGHIQSLESKGIHRNKILKTIPFMGFTAALVKEYNSQDVDRIFKESHEAFMKDTLSKGSYEAMKNLRRNVRKTQLN